MEHLEERNVTVLVIDDDVRLQTGIRDFLEPYSYKVVSLYSGKDAQKELDALDPDIVLLDIKLPGDDGFIILQQLRRVSRIPIIMLTALAGETDRIIGLEMGADDYLAKPFNPRELLARIKAVLRRTLQSSVDIIARGEPSPSNARSVDVLTLDSNRQKLCRNEKELFLSTTEFRLISVFMSHPEQILSRDQILTLALGSDCCVNSRNVDVYIHRIRKMLEGLGEDASRIRTVWGYGYCWTKDC